MSIRQYPNFEAAKFGEERTWILLEGAALNQLPLSEPGLPFQPINPLPGVRMHIGAAVRWIEKIPAGRMEIC